MLKFYIILGLLIAAPVFAVETTVSVQSVAEASAALTFANADTSNGNRFQNPNEDVLLVLRNVHATDAATVTIDAATASINDPVLGTVSKADNVVSLAAGDIKILGPFPRRTFNTTAEFVNMAVSGDAASSVRIAPFKSPKLVRQR